MAMINAKAAILQATQQPLVIEEVEVGDPGPGEVRVRMVATGICHTDLLMMSGHMPVQLPTVLGHEGAGVVESVGPAVTNLSPGDHVVLSYAHCGECAPCEEGQPTYCDQFVPRNFACCRLNGSTSLQWRHQRVGSHFFGQSSFATHAVCPASNVVKVAADLPLELLGPLGCGIQTGAGAVMNSLKVRPGSSLAVFGTGAVGLSAVMAGRVVSASKIVAIDRNPERLKLALELGADHAVDASKEDVAGRLAALLPRGCDYAIDTTGVPEVVNQAVAALASRGTCGLIAGVPGRDGSLPILHLLAGGRLIRGIVEGDSVALVFIPKLIDLHRQGRFPMSRLVRYFPFEEINSAIAATASGEVVKPILTFA
jgi:aryl-alcohol dehydrogenase